MITNEQINDFRKRSMQAVRPGRRQFSEQIDGIWVYLYSIQDIEDENELFRYHHGILDRIRDGSQNALFNKDFVKELGQFWEKCSWQIHVQGRCLGPFEEKEVDQVMADEMNRAYF